MFFHSKKYFISLIVFLVSGALSFSQSKKDLQKETKIIIGEKGLYPLYNYSTKEYGALPQNWSIMQDKRGVMYFGNNQGILEYDGVTWRMIRVPNETNIRSLAMDDNGKIFVGANADFGYLEPDSAGSIRFVSLLSKLSKDDREFSDVYTTLAAKDGIYFQSDNKIIRWNGKNMTVWNAEKSFHRIFYINGHLLIRQRDIGLMEIVNDQLMMVKGGELFADESIYTILPFTEKKKSTDKIILCTKTKGLFTGKFIQDKKSDPVSLSIENFHTQVDPFLFENINYHLQKTNIGYSVATITKGAVIIDNEGKLVNFLNKDIGLKEEVIYSQFVDNSGNLWLALSNGISKISINSPVTFFSDKNGPGGTIQKIIRHDNVIYVATEGGIFFLNPSSVENGKILSPPSFEHIPSINEECWDILSFHSGKNSSLLVASNRYVYSMDAQKKTTKLFSYNLWAFHQSAFDSSRIFLGLPEGFASMYWDGTKWIDEGTILEVKESVRSIAEDKEGNIWLGHDLGAIKINFKNKKGARKNNEANSYSLQKFDHTNGLPNPDASVELENVDGQILFFTANGILKFENGKFSTDDAYGKRFTDGSQQIHRAALDRQTGSIWMETFYPAKNKFEFGFLRKNTDKTYSWEITPFVPYSDEIIHAIFHEGNGITWFGGAAGLFRYDANEDKNEEKHFNSIVRRVTIGKDSTIFNGTFYNTAGTSALLQNPELKLKLPFASNSVVFEFSALDFMNEHTEQYQYFLEGFDKDWSKWKRETKVAYTNLPEGNYSFHVKAKNIFNQESNESVYELTVLPPWYRTWWAYVLYVLASIAFIYGVVTYFSRGLKAIIKERTAEIVKQKEEIEYKNRNITDSINYAKRIQEAILPHYELMKSKYPESFIIYRPKDIVAGDFYWFAEKEEKFIVAACDCTGHGVPGAFMSLIGYSLLNEVLLEKNFSSPAAALDSMKRGIIKSLGQTGAAGEQKDGMDMSLVTLEESEDGNKSNRKLMYAGANNSLYVVRKGELIELNADKMPIGIYLGMDKPFSNKEMILEKGDTFYMFSDGYADQFGGEKGKKFTKKRFKDLLLSLERTPMSQQKNILDFTMDEWLTNQQPIDDILVIGIKI